MIFDRDYTDCIIPKAEVRAGAGKPCGERDDASLKRRVSIIQKGTSVFAVLDRLYNYCYEKIKRKKNKRNTK